MADKINSLIDTIFLTSHYIQVEQFKKIESDEKVYSESCGHKERRLAKGH